MQKRVLRAPRETDGERLPVRTFMDSGTAEKMGAERIWKKVVDSYACSGDKALAAIDTMMERMAKMAAIMGGGLGLGVLKGKAVLDIGCGSMDSENRSRISQPETTWQPWLCRCLLAAGAKPAGIDIEPNTEKFRTYQGDVTLEETFAAFKDGSFDIVNNRALLPGRDLDSPDDMSPALRRTARARFGTDDEGCLKKAAALLYSQAQRLLKEGGWYFCESTYYMKQGGKLAEMGKFYD